MSQNITFITSNAKKVEQLSWHLHFPVQHKKIDLPEIQSLDLEEIITYKAKEAYKHVHTPVLVEDTSLVFNALNKLPGPLIKWFLTELGNEGICKILNGYEDRSALARVNFGYYDGNSVSIFEGDIEGSIALSPRGDLGFGWDPVFIPNGYEKTWGEMNREAQDATSMRKIALKKLAAFLG